MTTPADDCGVSGGCRACPLFAANVCGDPVPGAPPATDWAALVDAYLAEKLAALADAPDADPNEPRPEGSGCCGGRCG